MTLLDWEKAFDKVDRECLCDALERLGLHQDLIELLQDGYKQSTFFVKYQFGQSENKKQASGMRQGCVLSPYLLVLVMTCIEKGHNAGTKL